MIKFLLNRYVLGGSLFFLVIVGTHFRATWLAEAECQHQTNLLRIENFAQRRELEIELQALDSDALHQRFLKWVRPDSD